MSEADITLHTAGIIPSSYDDRDIGRVIFYDFAGDREYYSSHSAIVERISQSQKGSDIFFLVINLTKDVTVLHKELGYWLSFISYSKHNVNNECIIMVVVICSHVDLMTQADVQSKLLSLKQFSTKYSQQCKDFMKISEIVPMNCCQPRSSRNVKEIMRSITKRASPCSLSFEAVLLHGMLEKDFGTVVACKFQDLLSHIIITGIRLPVVASEVYPIARELHNVGLLMIIGRSEDQIEDYLLLMDVPALTNEVHQKLFSQSATQKFSSVTSPQYVKIGVLPESCLHDILPDHITKECLVKLQYCQEFSQAEVGLDYSVTQDDASSNLLLYFPALCHLDSEQSNWPPDPDLDFSVGWYARCTGEFDYFPHRYLHVLLLRLTFMFALPTATSQMSDLELSISTQNCHCTMWKNGIHWLMSEGIECIVKVVSESRGVVTVVKSRKKHTYQCVHMLTQIVNIITEAKTEFCYSVSLQCHIMNSSDLTSYSNEDKLYEFSMIESAIRNRDETVISVSGHQTLDLEKLSCIKCHLYWGKSSMKFKRVHWCHTNIPIDFRQP